MFPLGPAPRLRPPIDAHPLDATLAPGPRYQQHHTQTHRARRVMPLVDRSSSLPVSPAPPPPMSTDFLPRRIPPQGILQSLGLGVATACRQAQGRRERMSAREERRRGVAAEKQWAASCPSPPTPSRRASRRSVPGRARRLRSPPPRFRHAPDRLRPRPTPPFAAAEDPPHASLSPASPASPPPAATDVATRMGRPSCSGWLLLLRRRGFGGEAARRWPPLIGEKVRRGLVRREGRGLGSRFGCLDLGFHCPADGDGRRPERVYVAVSNRWPPHVAGPSHHRLSEKLNK